MKLLHIDLLQQYAIQMPNSQDTLQTFFTSWSFSLLCDHKQPMALRHIHKLSLEKMLPRVFGPLLDAL